MSHQIEPKVARIQSTVEYLERVSANLRMDLRRTCGSGDPSLFLSS